ncbi:MAG: tetratricopeptide repeat protein [Treponema sp.]|nr:tetratricopeptide repeat protein [Treponema sp.]
MFGFLKRLLGLFSSEKEEIDPDEIVEEQWAADFGAHEPRFRFAVAEESTHRVYVRKLNSAETGKNTPDAKPLAVLALNLLKTGCIAWSEDPLYRYEDLIIRGKIRIDPRGGYGAAGFMFRMVDENTYYMALVSNRGYFRLDLVRNRTPLALAGWTEAPALKHTGPGAEEALPVDFELEIVTCGRKILVFINDEWAAEISDSSLSEGRIAFCAASYEGQESPPASDTQHPRAEALLLAFSLDSRVEQVSARCDEVSSVPENRIRLAETFAAMGRANPALVQIRKAWESRREAEANAGNTEGRRQPARELFLAARLALALELWDEAAGCIEEGLSAGETGELAGEFRNLKAGLLYSRGAYEELLSWGEPADAVSFADPAELYNLLGHASFHLEKYEAAANDYDRAFAETEGAKNGHAAKNAARAWELLGNGENALARYIEAGRVFLDQNRYEELGLLVPKFRFLGAGNWEAHALAGKWAFGIENWEEADRELETAEKLRKELKPKSKPDPAVLYLKALLLLRKDKRQEALPLFEKAVKYAPGYPLFHFRLAETRFLLMEQSAGGPVTSAGLKARGSSPAADDPALAADLEAALRISRDAGESYGWVHNFAAQLALNRGDLAAASGHLEEAASVLGDVPEVRVNRAVSFYLNGKLDDALLLLECGPGEDSEGLMANCAGNLLVRAGRFEEADACYKKAVAAAPENRQHRFNRASCLVEMARYGEADNVLTSFPGGTSSPEILELIAFVAAKKGEYKRAEAASLAALQLNPGHAPSLLHLGWSYAAGGRWEEVTRIIAKLDELELNEEMVKGKEDLSIWMRDATSRLVTCASCGTQWRVRKNPDPVPPIRLYAMPPDTMPAGSCLNCGASYCVGCRKDALDEAGRFTCPECGNPLKLNDEGLKELIYSWAEKNLPRKPKAKKKKSPATPPVEATVADITPPPADSAEAANPDAAPPTDPADTASPDVAPPPADPAEV